MIKFVKRRVAAVAVLILFLATSFMPSVVMSAQENPGSGLRISPTRSELALQPGDEKVVTQTVKNVTKSPITVEALLNDFESDGTTGQPKLIGDPNVKSVYSLREFISLPEKFDLNPDEEKSVSVSLKIPKETSPGAYFGSVLYRATPQGASGGGQVALVASVGSLVLVEISGNITEKIEIKNVSGYINDKKGSIFTKKPTSVGVLIGNLGNGFSKPFGKVSVRNWKDKEIFIYDMNGTEPKANILPNSDRLFLNDLMNVEKKTVNGKEEETKKSPITWPGRYTIIANISHGSAGELYTVRSTFWYIPSWLIIAMVVLVLALVAAAVFLYRKYANRSMRRR